MHVCPMVTPGTPPVPHVGGPVMTGFPTVLIGGMPAARVTDTAICVGPPDTIVKGSLTVMIGNMPAARLGDPTVHGGMISVGCPTVIIGDAGGGGSSVATKTAHYLKELVKLIKLGRQIYRATPVAVRIGNAIIMAMRFGPDSPFLAFQKSISRNFASYNPYGTLVGIGLESAIGGFDSLERNLDKLHRKEISAANLAGRVGFGTMQGAVKGAVSAGTWAIAGAVVGSIAGAAVGSMAGGVGAFPGAVAGAKIGAQAGMMFGPLFDKFVLQGWVKQRTDSIAKMILPDKYEENAGNFTEKHLTANRGASNGPQGGSAGAIAGCMFGSKFASQ
jgi:uncharacterized Zn-binding protein involved in type VI secretion